MEIVIVITLFTLISPFTFWFAYNQDRIDKVIDKYLEEKNK